MLILFPDDHHIVKADNITFRQATLLPSEPILSPDLHWEGNRTHMYGTVLRQAECYAMYYQCGNALRVGYAVSDDGWQWHKPMINAADFSASVHEVVQANDQVDPSAVPLLGEGQEMTNLAAGYHMPSVIYEADSDTPYKMFAFGEEGYRVLYSHNGRQFTEFSGNPVIPQLNYKNEDTGKTWVSDVSPCFKDRSGYTAMVKTYVVDSESRTRRCVGRSTSDDFLQWSEVETLWVPGDAEDTIAKRRGYQWADFYGLCPFQWGSGYLGYLWLFEIEKELPRGTNLGKIEVFLAYSPNGTDWRRIAEQPLIPWDLNFGADGGMVTTPSAPVFEDDSIKVYYSDSNFEHGFAEKDFTREVEAPIWVTRCAELPRERLVGAYSEKGELQLSFAGGDYQQLRLNLTCTDGEVSVSFLSGERVLSAKQVGCKDATALMIDVPAECKSGRLDGLRIGLKGACLYAVELS